MVIDASGRKESTILVGEGDEQQAMSRAKSDRQASTMRAEGYLIAPGTLCDATNAYGLKTVAIQRIEAPKLINAVLSQVDLADRVHRAYSSLRGTR